MVEVYEKVLHILYILLGVVCIAYVYVEKQTNSAEECNGLIQWITYFAMTNGINWEHEGHMYHS